MGWWLLPNGAESELRVLQNKIAQYQAEKKNKKTVIACGSCNYSVCRSIEKFNIYCLITHYILSALNCITAKFDEDSLLAMCVKNFKLDTDTHVTLFEFCKYYTIVIVHVFS